MDNGRSRSPRCGSGRKLIEFGITSGPISLDMKGVRCHKRQMVDDLIAVHWRNCADSGTELIMDEVRELIALAVAVTLRCDGLINR